MNEMCTKLNVLVYDPKFEIAGPVSKNLSWGWGVVGTPLVHLKKNLRETGWLLRLHKSTLPVLLSKLSSENPQT